MNSYHKVILMNKWMFKYIVPSLVYITTAYFGLADSITIILIGDFMMWWF